MNFITDKVRRQQIIQIAFVLFLIGSVINPVKDIKQAEIPVITAIADTTLVISSVSDTIREVVVPPFEPIIETGINQTQTSKRKPRLPQSDPEANTETFVVPTHIQAENLLDQGYSIKDIANELGLDKKEVRKLKRKQRKEERAALARRKKEARANSQ